jgi:hypothetical protein
MMLLISISLHDHHIENFEFRPGTGSDGLTAARDITLPGHQAVPSNTTNLRRTAPKPFT